MLVSENVICEAGIFSVPENGLDKDECVFALSAASKWLSLISV
jgi:hypothetical protein